MRGGEVVNSMVGVVRGGEVVNSGSISYYLISNSLLSTFLEVFNCMDCNRFD